MAVQEEAKYEHIIIDGGSTDGSTNIIEKYQSCFSYACSEKDTGIYQAMNKGIAAAKGDYLLFLNSGDTLKEPHVLSSLFEQIKQRDSDIYYTDIMLIDEFNKKAFRQYYPQQVDTRYFVNATFSHQAACIRKILFDKLGLYHEKYTITSDRAFFLKAAKYGYTFEYLPALVLSNYNLHGLSNDYVTAHTEMEEILDNEHPDLLTLVRPNITPSLVTRAWQKLLRDLPFLQNLNITKTKQRRENFSAYQKQMTHNITLLNRLLSTNDENHIHLSC